MAESVTTDGLVPALQTEVEQLHTKINVLLRLQRYSYELAGEQNLDRLLQIFVDASKQLLNAYSSSLLLLDEQTGELVFALTGGIHEEVFQNIRLRPGEGIVGRVVATGHAEIVNDVSKDPNWSANVDNITQLNTYSLAAVPLVVGNHTIGAIEVVNKMIEVKGEQRIDLQGFTEGDKEILLALASQAAVAIERTRLLHYLSDQQRRLVAAQEDVRRKIQRDLHDGPAQRLTAMTMNIKFIQQCLERMPERVPHELVELENLSVRTSREIRTLLFELRPIVLQTQGLIPALEQYVERLNNDGMNVLLLVDPFLSQAFSGQTQPLGGMLDTVPLKPLERLHPDIENTVFTIVQEAINNSKKHARANQVIVEVQREGDELVASVTDDGRGFNLADVERNYDQRGSFGLLTMRERAEMVRGNWTIQSTPGQGTAVTLRVPVNIPAQPRLFNSVTIRNYEP